ncbi:MAG: hypothetical protein JKY09_06295 [Crocinitomicaceae bacterium]|nr:hypothetical protein [Crocinitomicaceae bacterium]
MKTQFGLNLATSDLKAIALGQSKLDQDMNSFDRSMSNNTTENELMRTGLHHYKEDIGVQIINGEINQPGIA